MTQAELEQKYRDAGNLRRLASVLEVSKTTLQKYLSHIACNTKPWASVEPGASSDNQDYLRRRYRREVMEHFEHALLTQKTWRDAQGRTIPREAFDIITVTPPRKMVPIMPAYGKLKGTGEIVTILFQPRIDWLSPRPAEHSSDEESRHSSDLPASTSNPH
jgi:hypothetical protein